MTKSSQPETAVITPIAVGVKAEPAPPSPWSAHIIFGEPTNKDQFDGGGHDRSARALADGIRQLAERTGGRKRAGGAIGLEGAWGSGKSTVIDIAKDRHLGQDYLVFTFDLWRHHSDDFRRALLEQFIEFARAAFNPLGKDDRHLYRNDDPRPKAKVNVDEKFDEIRNRKSVTTTSSNRRITLFGTFLALLLPLLPIGYSFLSPVALRGVDWPSTDIAGVEISWGLAGPVVGLIIYLCVTAVILLAAFNSSHFADKKSFHGRTAWIRGGASHLLNLSERDQNNEVTQKIRDESPTTVEFRTVFEELLTPLQKTGKRIVFVLDNIDRIPAADLPKVWAELRSLIAGNGPDPLSSVVAVIPYDRDHVGQAYPPVKLPRLIEDENGEHLVDRQGGVDIETDVFEKTFDRVVKVSAPVPSAWKLFLFDRIKDAAFQGHHSSDYAEKLFRLLQFKMQRDGVHPTPRRIISFVNDVGGLWAQWYDSTIPIETVGLYVLHRHLFDRDPAILTRPAPVPVRFVRIVDDPDWAKNLAALAFNVPPELANQVRLEAPITKALTKDDGHIVLKELAEAQGFHEIFPDVLRKRLAEWVADSPESIAVAAKNVSQLSLPPETVGPTWQFFADAIQSLDVLPYEVATLPGLYLIVERQTRMSPELMAGILRAKFERDTPGESDGGILRKGTLWLHMMRNLANALNKVVGRQAAEAFWRTEIPSGLVEFNIGVISSVLPTDLPFDAIKLGSANVDTSAALIKMIEVNPRGYHFAMRVVASRLKDHLSEHLDAISTAIERLEPDETNLHVLKAAAHLMRWTTASALEQAFASTREVYLPKYARWASQHDSAEDFAAALYLMAYTTEGTEISSPRGAVLTDDATWYNGLRSDAEELDDDVLDALAQKVRWSFEGSEWISFTVKAAMDTGLFARVLRRFPQAGDMYIRDIKFLVEKFDRVIELAGQETGNFLLLQLDDEEELREALTGEVVRGIPATMIGALARFEEGTVAKIALSVIDEHLRALDGAAWHEALTTRASKDRRLLVSMQKHTSVEVKSGNFIQGLVATAEDVLSERFDPNTVAADLPNVLGAIPLSQYAPLRAQIASKMQKSDVTAAGSVLFVKHLGKVAQKMRFSSNSDLADWALTHFLYHLANSEDPVAREYLEANADEVTATLRASSSGDIRQAFEEVLHPRTSTEATE